VDANVLMCSERSMQLPTTLSDAAQDHLRRGYGGSLHEILKR
jgi:hypothetical protein